MLLTDEVFYSSDSEKSLEEKASLMLGPFMAPILTSMADKMRREASGLPQDELSCPPDC